MILRKGQKVEITSNHNIAERNGVHHCFGLGEVVVVDYDVDTEKQTPLLVDEQGIKQFVKEHCFKIL